MQIKLSTDGCTDFMFILESTVNHGIMMQPYHSYFIGPMNICSTLITSSGTINTFEFAFVHADYPFYENFSKRIDKYKIKCE